MDNLLWNSHIEGEPILFHDHKPMINQTMMMVNLGLILIPFFLLILLTNLNFIKKWKMRSKDSANIAAKKLPPGPWKLPIIGSIHHLMGSLPHQALRNLAQKHGDLMHLQLGEIPAIVVSSPRTARAIMKTHDLAFANRLECLVGKIILYNYSDVGFCPYGDYWRQMRKICSLELLSTRNVRSLGSIRQDEAFRLVSSIQEEARIGKKSGGVIINFTQKTSSYTSSMVCRAAFGRTFGVHRDILLELIKEALLLTSGFDVSDLFPSLKILHHLSRMKPKLLELHRKMDEILDIIIREHAENPTGRNGEFGQEDLIDVLLRNKQSGDLPFPITNTNIKAVLLDMFTGGVETSATAVEWAMSEMMKHPDILAKAQNEIRKSSLMRKEIIEEADIQSFSYLKLVIKETLRLHPPLPLLIPRESREQCEIDGYIIPPKTRVLVNAWAIGRDPEAWDDPESFRPERFENHSVDFNGTNHEYIPFGAGRRSCPGISFGLANIEVPLANLLYFFDWKLPDGVENSDLDMTETHGITAARKNNLLLIPSMYTNPGL
ncbi:OLC1v1024707C1 [Oldenlandia corymbosa var. corymbosa]|uniref:OLC1v1024707C1 n=1 Tax=Oldenlandia corymbosa var. corymbosa TaxID=529605 RepID=A0AAV1C5U4_OLDCO|nr:OLC1v1024707C1 [Oldenlandia corymbosa var. corymbosa]